MSRVLRGADGGDVFVSVVSDGAGSASRSDVGAQVVCDTLMRCVTECVPACADLDELSDELLGSWFLEVRNVLRAAALAADVNVREYAATAVLALAGERQTLCAQIGDGAIVVRRAPDEPFEIVMWPQSGEYANQTYFVTDDDAPKHLEIRRDGHVSDLIAFSDGLQSLALQLSTRSAYGPFFDPLVRVVRAADGANGKLGEALIAYLNSDAVNGRTDDDKSLAIGCRVSSGD